MRRTLSILLVLGLGMGPAMAAVPASALSLGLISALRSGTIGKVDESHLPACCRHNGKHHCRMGDGADAARGETGLSAKDTCPFLPRSLASTAPTVAAIVSASTNSIVIPTELRALQGDASEERIRNLRVWQARGPPSLSL
jgi:hypothetical protein